MLIVSEQWIGSVTYKLDQLPLLDLDPKIFNIRKVITTPILQFKVIGRPACLLLVLSNTVLLKHGHDPIYSTAYCLSFCTITAKPKMSLSGPFQRSLLTSTQLINLRRRKNVDFRGSLRSSSKSETRLSLLLGLLLIFAGNLSFSGTFNSCNYKLIKFKPILALP